MNRAPLLASVFCALSVPAFAQTSIPVSQLASQVAAQIKQSSYAGVHLDQATAGGTPLSTIAAQAAAAAPQTALSGEVQRATQAEAAAQSVANGAVQASGGNASAALVTATGASSSRTMAAISADELTAATNAAGAVQAAGGNASQTMVTPTGGVARTQAAMAADTINVKNQGAQGNTVLLQENVYTLANGYPANQIILSNGGVTSDMVGETAIIAGAGAPGVSSHLIATVLSVTDATHIVLSSPADATGSFTGQIVIGYHGLPQTGVTYNFTAGSTTVTASTAVFNSGHVAQGIILPGAGVAPFSCKISSVPTSSSIVCAATPTTALNSVGMIVPIGTDDTAAIQAAYAAAEARTTPAVYFPDGRYLTTSSLNLTGFGGGITSGTGTIYGAVPDLPVVDELSARFTRWTGVNIVGDPATLPIAGLAVGRISGASADNHRFSNFTINGAYGLTALEDVGAESTPFTNVQFANSVGPFTAILDGIHHFADASVYVTQAQSVDAPNSFNEAVFTADLFSGSSATGAPIWLAATGKTRFDTSSYLASASPQGVVLYGVSSANISLPVFDLHMEPTTLKYDFVIDGPNSPSITNMQWRDHNIQAQTAAFHIDANAGFTTQNLNDVDFTLGVNSTVTPVLFDAPANWFVTGNIHSPASLFNLSPAIANGNTSPNWSGCYSPVYSGQTCSNQTMDGITTVRGPETLQQGAKIAGTNPLQIGDSTSGGYTTISGDGTGKVAPYRFNAAGSYQANSLDLIGGETLTAPSGSDNSSSAITSAWARTWIATYGYATTTYADAEITSTKAATFSTLAVTTSMTAAGPVTLQEGAKVSATTPIQLGDATSGGWTTLSGDGTGKISPYRFNAAGSYQANSLDLAGGASLTAPLKIAVYTVSTLPACNSAAEGSRAGVSDAIAPTFLGTLTGGGLVHAPAYCNGTAWVAG